MKTRTIVISALCMLALVGCTACTVLAQPVTAPVIATTTEPAITEPVVETETEPAPITPATEHVIETVTETTAPATETQLVTEPTEPEPVELTFSAYPQGTKNLSSITSDQGITISIDSDYYFEFPEYKGIKFWQTDDAMINHRNSVSFECENAYIESIELLGPDKQRRISPLDGKPVDPIPGSTVSGDYWKKIGYWYLRIYVVSNEEKFQLTLIQGSR